MVLTSLQRLPGPGRQEMWWKSCDDFSWVLLTVCTVFYMYYSTSDVTINFIFRPLLDLQVSKSLLGQCIY